MTDLQNLEQPSQKQELIGQSLAVLDHVTEELHGVQVDQDQLAALLEQSPYLIDIGPMLILEDFYSLTEKLLSDLRGVLEGENVDNISEEVLKLFVRNEILVSYTPDLLSPEAAAGNDKVPALQASVDLRLRVLLIMVRFLDLQKFVNAANDKLFGIDEVDLKLALSALAEVVRSMSGDFRAYYNALNVAGIKGQEMMAITAVMVAYFEGIKTLIDPNTRSTTLDLFPNIINNLHSLTRSAQMAWIVETNTRTVPPAANVES